MTVSVPGLCSVEWWGDLVIGKNLEVKIMTWSKYYPGICLEDLRKNTKTLVRLTGVLGEMGTEHLLNTSLE